MSLVPAQRLPERFALGRAELGLDERHGPVFVVDGKPGRALLAVDPQLPHITAREIDGLARMLKPVPVELLRVQDSLCAECPPFFADLDVRDLQVERRHVPGTECDSLCSRGFPLLTRLGPP